MSDRFTRDRSPRCLRSGEKGRVLRFRVPLGGVLARPLWRWSAAVVVVLLGTLLVALSLRPGWFFPETTAPLPRTAAGDETRGEPVCPLVLSWGTVEGAALYRLSFLDPDTGRLVLSLTTPRSSFELPSEAAARLAPAATCELVVEALSAENEVLSRESRMFEPPRSDLDSTDE
jgi:hypothetical protein